MLQGDTARAPDEGYTAGGKTIQIGGVNVSSPAFSTGCTDGGLVDANPHTQTNA